LIELPPTETHLALLSNYLSLRSSLWSPRANPLRSWSVPVLKLVVPDQIAGRNKKIVRNFTATVREHSTLAACLDRLGFQQGGDHRPPLDIRHSQFRCCPALRQSMDCSMLQASDLTAFTPDPSIDVHG